MSFSRDGNAEASSSSSHAPPSPSPSQQTPRPRSSSFHPPQTHLPVQYHVFAPSPLSDKAPRSLHVLHAKLVQLPPQLHSMAAGAGAGFVASVVTCPLDVVKTRLQAQHLARDAEGYEGVRSTIRRIWRQAGVRGFYRGLGPTLGGYLPTWGIYFTVYDMVKDQLGSWAKTHRVGGPTLVHIAAAMTAGASGTIVTNPLWVVKTRFMSQAVLPPSAARYRNTLDAIVSIYRHEGFRAFYKGLLPSLIGVSHVAVQFPLYEKAKSWADRRTRDPDSPTPANSALPPSTILACSAFSKMVASLATYPHEVLRTRLQIAKNKSSSSPPASGAETTSAGAASARTRVQTGIVGSVELNRGVTPIYSPLISGSNPPVPVSPSHPSLPPPEASKVTWLRSRWQGREGGVIDTFLSIRNQDGWRGFYRGLSINLVRTVPNSAVTMLTYELIMRYLS